MNVSKFIAFQYLREYDVQPGVSRVKYFFTYLYLSVLCLNFQTVMCNSFYEVRCDYEIKYDVKYENGFLLWSKRVYHFNTC